MTTRLELPQPVHACILDLDGTLVDTLGDFEAALAVMLAEWGHPPLTRAVIARLVGKGSEHLIEAALVHAGVLRAPPDSAAGQALQRAAMHNYQAAYAQVNGRFSIVYPGVLDGLAALKARALPLAVLTNKPRSLAHALLVAKGLAGYFDHVFGGDSFARKKPDPLPLLETCRALATPAAQTLMIGDSSNDAMAARAAGCPVVLMSHGYNHGRPVSEVDADACFDRLSDLAAALGAARA